MIFNVRLFSLYTLMLFMPWTGFLINTVGSSITLVVYMPILLLMLIKQFNKGINFRDKLTLLFSLLFLDTLITNLVLMDNIIVMIKFPVTILLLMLSYLTTKELVLQNKLNIKSLYYIALYQLFVVAILISIDKLLGIQYYSYQEDDIVGGIGGNISKYAAILFPLIGILSYYKALVFQFVHLTLILLTLRRSALIGLIFFNLFKWLLSKNDFNLLKKDKLKVLMFIAGIIILLISINLDFLNQFINTLETRLLDLSEGSGGGRSKFWLLAVDLYLSYDISGLLFGNPGALAPYLYTHFGMAIGAHSDILDFLCNYGAVGLLLYLTNYYIILHYFYQNIKLNRKESVIGISITLSVLFLSITTGGYFYMLNLMYFIFIGFLFAVIKKKETYE